MIIKSIPAAMLLALLAACGGGGDNSNTQAPPARVLGINDLKLFIQSQQLHLQAKLVLHPSTADWSAIDPEIKVNKLLEPDGFPVEGSYAITHGADLPTHRVCVRFGPYALARPLNEAGCPGDWLQNRADSRSTATSMFRLNWDQPPAQQRELSLQIRQGLAVGRVDTAILPTHGLTAFVENGSVIEAHSELGRLIWRSDSVGMGEIIDAIDLDGDAMPEVVFVARSGFSASGPGQLMVLSASTGEMLWRYQFEGLELGMNRYRTTIASLDGTGAKSILATMTYNPSLFRFDFSQGARNGVLAWKSEQFIYDSPDKNPLVGDFDADGELEVVVDSLGTLYRLNAADGRIESRLGYESVPTFQGFLASRPLADSSGFVITSASDSAYYKGFISVLSSASGLAPAASQRWETGLNNASVSVEFLDAPLETFDRLGGAVPVTINEGAGNTLHLIDLNTGSFVWSLPGYRAAYPLAGPGGTQALAAQGPEGAVILSLDRAQPVVLATFPGSVFLGAKTIRGCTPAKRSTCGRGGALRIDPGGKLHLDKLESHGKVITLLVSGSGFSSPRSVVSVSFSGEFILISDSESLFRIDSTGLATRWLSHTPQVFMTPLVADMHGQGIREIIAPYAQGLSRLRVENGILRSEIPVFGAVPSQEAESFGVPVVLNSGTEPERSIVGLRWTAGASGASRLSVSAAAANGSITWDAQFNQNGGERSLLALPGGARGDNVALRHSRGTQLMDGRTGQIRWSNEEIGECQRQMASVDWNGDGVGDLLVQTGSMSWVYGGTDGAVLYSQNLRATYGAYSAAAGNTTQGFSLVQSGAGAMAFASQAGASVDFQIDPRRIESLPVVIGKQSRLGEERVFRINGTGDLAVYDKSGQLLQQEQWRAPVVTMTGAYVDEDASIDLLLSTSDGQLIAVSGKDLKEIWRVQLDGALGTPVASTLNGIDPVILVSSSRGVLYVLEN